jgi:hypothetical protein
MFPGPFSDSLYESSEVLRPIFTKSGWMSGMNVYIRAIYYDKWNAYQILWAFSPVISIGWLMGFSEGCCGSSTGDCPASTPMFWLNKKSVHFLALWLWGRFDFAWPLYFLRDGSVDFSLWYPVLRSQNLLMCLWGILSQRNDLADVKCFTRFRQLAKYHFDKFIYFVWPRER